VKKKRNSKINSLARTALHRARTYYVRALRAKCRNELFFPLTIPLGAGAKRAGLFSDVRTQTDDLEKSLHGYAAIHYCDTNTRVYGRISYPVSIEFLLPENYFRYLGFYKEANQCLADYTEIIREIPELHTWAAENIPAVIEGAGLWPELLRTVKWFIKNPMSGVFIREIPSVNDTKFIENHTGILKKILDHILPDTAVRKTHASFIDRYGLKREAPMIRLRALDTDLAESLGYSDLVIPVHELRFGNGCRRIIFLENKMVFLTYPKRPHTCGIWGGGFSVLQIIPGKIPADAELWYWGDLDAQGFLILGRLREKLPALRSFFMSVEIFEQYKQYAVPGTPCTDEPPCTLTSSEREMYQFLRQRNIRLEQERIPYTVVLSEGK